MSAWYRTVAYNFVLIICNTGMRPPEAKNLRWRDVAVRIGDQGRASVVLAVLGKTRPQPGRRDERRRLSRTHPRRRQGD